jgi:hypothetical protein
MAVAVVAAFLAVPEAVLIMTVLGLIVGVMEDNSNRVYWLVMAVALSSVSGAAGPLRSH